MEKVINGNLYTLQLAADPATGAALTPPPFDLSLIASAAFAATQNTADQQNLTGRGLRVVLDVTVPGTGSITLTIQGKDPASGKYYTLLQGAAVTTLTTNVYEIYPGITAVANQAANLSLPRVWRVLVTANNANPMTYSVGATVLR